MKIYFFCQISNILLYLVIGEALFKEIEAYEQCHPALDEIKDKLVYIVNQYNNLFM